MENILHIDIQLVVHLVECRGHLVLESHVPEIGLPAAQKY